MLKKFVCIFLIGLVSINCFGIVMQKHYCCGKLKNTETSIFGTAWTCCPAENHPSNCCHDEIVRVVNDQDFFQYSYTIDIELPVLVLELALEKSTHVIYSTELRIVQWKPPPPLIRKDFQAELATYLI